MSEPSCRVEGRDRKNYFSIHLRDFKGFSPAQGQEFQRHVVWPGCQSTFHSLSWEVYWPIVRTIRGLGIQGPESAPTDPVAQYIYPRPLLILKLNSRVWHKGWQHFQILTLALLQMQNLPQLPSWVDSSLRALGHRPGLPQTHSLSLMVLEVLTHPRTTVCTSAPVPSSSYPLTHDFKTLSLQTCTARWYRYPITTLQKRHTGWRSLLKMVYGLAKPEQNTLMRVGTLYFGEI